MVQIGVDNAGDVDVTGLASGVAVASTDVEKNGKVHRLFESYPKFTVNSGSPANLAPIDQSTSQLLAIFDVQAIGPEDITFNTTDSIIFQVTVVGDGNVASSTIRFLDDQGNTLDSDQAITSNTITTAITLNFTTNTLTIPAGQTKQIHVRLDTSRLENNGDSVQIWLDDVTTDLDFGVDGRDDTNTVGDIVFRSDIFAGTLVNPS